MARKLVAGGVEDKLTTDEPANEGHMPRARLWWLAGPVALLQHCAWAEELLRARGPTSERLSVGAPGH